MKPFLYRQNLDGSLEAAPNDSATEVALRSYSPPLGSSQQPLSQELAVSPSPVPSSSASQDASQVYSDGPSQPLEMPIDASDDALHVYSDGPSQPLVLPIDTSVHDIVEEILTAPDTRKVRESIRNTHVFVIEEDENTLPHFKDIVEEILAAPDAHNALYAHNGFANVEAEASFDEAVLASFDEATLLPLSAAHAGGANGGGGVGGVAPKGI